MESLKRLLGVLALVAALVTSGCAAPRLEQGSYLLPPINLLPPSSPPAGLNYYGGPLQTAPKVYVSFWGPEWARGFTTCQTFVGCYTSGQAESYATGFLSAVGGSQWESVDTQYGVGNPVNQLAGFWTDPTPVPATPTEADITAAAQRLAAHFGTPNPNADYMVLTPTGKTESGAVAHHSWVGPVRYSYIPYEPDQNGYCLFSCPGFFDSYSEIIGHEMVETITDPTGAGWHGSAPETEIGDLCQEGTGAPGAGNTAVTFGNGQSYVVQSLWSNRAHACVY